MANLPPDYPERAYAAVLGKLIGVYLGRPFEGWTYERIMAELGEVTDYVHERFNRPLIVTDDDISGTLTFLRALPDHGNRLDLTPREIGETWLNYIIEQRTILWWAGRLHRAYRLSAPQSGRACPPKRFHRSKRPGRGRANRVPDLHRRLGHGR